MASVRDLILQITERKSGNALTEAARDLEDLSRGVDASGASMKKAETDAKRLNDELLKTNARIKDLHKQYAATGDTSLFGDIRKEEQRARNLTKSLKSIFSDGGGQSGNSFLKAFSKVFDAGAEGIKPLHALIAALVVMVVAAAPAIGAALAGAITGVAIIGALAGGIFAASKDPSVRSAAHQFGDTIGAEFFSSGSSFVEPIRKSLGILAADFRGMDLGGTFAKAAPFLEILASGIGDFVLNIMPGLNKALDRAGPFIDATARGLGELGMAIGDLIDRASASHGAIEGLEFLFSALSVTIIGLGNVVHWLSDAFHWMNERAAQTLDAIAVGLDALGFDEKADQLHRFAEQIREYANKDLPYAAHAGLEFGDASGYAAHRTEELAAAIDKANDAQKRYTDNALAASDASLAVAQGWLDLNEKLVKGKENWSNNTQAGIDNQKMLNDQIQALGRARDAEIKKSDGSVAAIDKINLAYDENLKKLLAVAAQAGASKAQLEALAKTYFIKVITIEERVDMAKQNKRAALEQAENRLAGYRASGGPVQAGRRYRVGENGPEDFVPGQNGYITPNGGGGGALRLEVGGAPSGPLESMFLQWLMTALRGAIRGQGGELAVLGLKAP